MKGILAVGICLVSLLSAGAPEAAFGRDDFDQLLEQINRVNRHDPAAAAALAGPARQYLEEHPDPGLEIRLGLAMAPQESLVAGYEGAGKRLTKLIGPAHEVNRPELVPLLRVAFSDLALRYGDIRFAFRQILDTFRHISPETSLETRRRVALQAARVNLAAGFPSVSLRILESVKDIKAPLGDICEMHIVCIEAEALLAAGKYAEMAALLDNLPPEFDEETEADCITHFWILRAWSCLVMEKMDQAIEYLAASRKWAERSGSLAFKGEIACLEALLAQIGPEAAPDIPQSLDRARMQLRQAANPDRFPELLAIAHKVFGPEVLLLREGYLMQAMADYTDDPVNLRASALGHFASAELLFLRGSQDSIATNAHYRSGHLQLDHFNKVMSGLQAEWFSKGRLLGDSSLAPGNASGDFYLLVLVLILIIVLLGLLLRIRTQRHVTRQLQKAVEKARLAGKAAEESSRMKSQFLANVSHEIKTPMSGLVGMVSILDEIVADPLYRKYITTIRTCSQNLMVLMNDLLDLGRMESGRMDIERKSFDLLETVDYSLDVVRDAAVQKDLDLERRLESDLPRTVVGDSTRVSQVLTNLLVNAIKFTETGRVILEVSFQRTLGNSGNLTFRVRDTGPGIAPGKLHAIFEPFSQGDVPTEGTQTGSGLGLAICRKLVELMGGSISADSVVGRGSVFTVSIPVRT